MSVVIYYPMESGHHINKLITLHPCSLHLPVISLTTILYCLPQRPESTETLTNQKSNNKKERTRAKAKPHHRTSNQLQTRWQTEYTPALGKEKKTLKPKSTPTLILTYMVLIEHHMLIVLEETHKRNYEPNWI